MLLYFILCKTSKDVGQRNKLAKFDGGNIMSSHMTLEVSRSKYG